MIEKFRVGLALQPVATALFASSPFKEGAPTGYQSWRSHVWSDVDNNRCGDLPWVFNDDFGFERYVDYAMDVPMYFAYRDGQYKDVTGESFRDFLTGDLKGCPGARCSSADFAVSPSLCTRAAGPRARACAVGEVATLDDWEAHLTTIFPEVRLKRYMEMRGADGGPAAAICALSALWIGLLYDAPTQQKCVELIADWTQEERSYLRAEVRHGCSFARGIASSIGPFCSVQRPFMRRRNVASRWADCRSACRCQRQACRRRSAMERCRT